MVVNVSKTKAARESFVESGVDEKDRNEASRCDRMVVLPEPDSPLQSQETQHLTSKRYKWIGGRPHHSQKDHCLILSPPP